MDFPSAFLAGLVIISLLLDLHELVLVLIRILHFLSVPDGENRLIGDDGSHGLRCHSTRVHDRLMWAPSNVLCDNILFEASFWIGFSLGIFVHVLDIETDTVSFDQRWKNLI